MTNQERQAIYDLAYSEGYAFGQRENPLGYSEREPIDHERGTCGCECCLTVQYRVLKQAVRAEGAPAWKMVVIMISCDMRVWCDVRNSGSTSWPMLRRLINDRMVQVQQYPVGNQ